jgi:hypothetical protein
MAAFNEFSLVEGSFALVDMLKANVLNSNAMRIAEAKPIIKMKRQRIRGHFMD